MVIWITGLSGAGKTTLSQAIYRLVKRKIPGSILLDGDHVRQAFGNDLGYSEEARRRQLRRVQNITKMLVDQGMLVIVAVLYAHPDFLKWNRENFSEYYEVYLEADLEKLKERNDKALYSKALQGEIRDVVGLDIPWHEPVNPHFKIAVDWRKNPEKMALEVVAQIPFLSRRMETRRSNDNKI